MIIDSENIENNKNWSKQAKFYLRQKISTVRPIYMPIARIKYGLNRVFDVPWAVVNVVSKETDILIEGFPRSGNSFARVAFELAQEPDIVQASSHLHAPAHVYEAIKHEIPVIILIRDPKDVAISTLIYRPFLEIEYILQGYINFYKALLPHQKHFVVAPFTILTKNFGEIIQIVNHRFHVAFKLFKNSSENVQEVFQRIEKNYKDRRSNNELPELHVGRPTLARKEMKQKIESKFWNREFTSLQNKAYSLYETFIEISNQ